MRPTFGCTYEGICRGLTEGEVVLSHRVPDWIKKQGLGGFSLSSLTHSHPQELFLFCSEGWRREGGVCEVVSLTTLSPDYPHVSKQPLTSPVTGESCSYCHRPSQYWLDPQLLTKINSPSLQSLHIRAFFICSNKKNNQCPATVNQDGLSICPGF